MKEFLLIIILGLSVLSCNNKKKEIGNDCGIDSIRIKYLYEDITFSHPPRVIDLLNWRSMKKQEVLNAKNVYLIDTVITNNQLLEEIKGELANLKKGKCYDENMGSIQKTV